MKALTLAVALCAFGLAGAAQAQQSSSGQEITEGQARSMASEKYSNLSGFTQDRQGNWHTTAQKGGQMVDVTVHANGKVTSP